MPLSSHLQAIGCMNIRVRTSGIARAHDQLCSLFVPLGLLIRVELFSYCFARAAADGSGLILTSADLYRTRSVMQGFDGTM